MLGKRDTEEQRWSECALFGSHKSQAFEISESRNSNAASNFIFFSFILDFVLFVSFVTIVDTIRTVVTTASPAPAPATAAATEIRRKLLWIFSATHLPILTFIGEFTVFRVRCATDKCINKNISSTNVNCMLNGYGLPQWVILVGCWECVCSMYAKWCMANG